MKTSGHFLSCILVGAVMIICLAGSAAAGKKNARIGYVQWSCATAASNVVKAVLQEKMGYECKLEPMSAQNIWLSTASKNIDGFVCAWLPSLHQHLYAKTGYNVRDLGPNLTGTKVGLVVPEYVSIDSIAQVKEQAEKFNNRIIGIDPDAGIMRLTKQAIKDYQMEYMELVSGSGLSMTRTLEKKINNQEWVIVTGWTPHWKFAKWDLKYLKDPKGTYGGSESIHTMVRIGLKEDDPRLYRFLDNFKWRPDDIQEVMEMIRTSGRPYQSAVAWINEHPEQVQAWIPKE